MPANITDIFRLDGRLALVTGASSGLGRQFALTLARAGAAVAVAARRSTELANLVGQIESAGGQAFAVPLDVRDAVSVAACFDLIALRDVPDVIVNNAGITVQRNFSNSPGRTGTTLSTPTSAALGASRRKAPGAWSRRAKAVHS